MENEEKREMTVRYRAEGLDWKAHGFIHGTWAAVERMGRVFEKIENEHNPMQKPGDPDAESKKAEPSPRGMSRMRKHGMVPTESRKTPV